MADGVFTLWFVILVQLLGIASITFARLSENSSAQIGFQRLFFVCLLTVGLASAATIHVGDASRLFCALTLPIMTVGATLDLRTRSPHHQI